LKRILLAALTCIPFYAQADDAAAKKVFMQGKDKGAPACEQCHGADGGGTPAAGFPRLAGLQQEYIKHQLLSFRSGTRNNPVMEPIAKSLSDKEVSSLAVYLAALPVPAATPEGGDAALMSKGKALANRGDWNNGIPACFQCHGPEGKGVGARSQPGNQAAAPMIRLG
jgi:cytochrome c553